MSAEDAKKKRPAQDLDDWDSEHVKEKTFLEQVTQEEDNKTIENENCESSSGIGGGWPEKTSYESFTEQRPKGMLPEDETYYLREEELDPNPMLQFGKFYAERILLNPKGPPIMTVATCSKTGRPSARTVILNGFDENGFLFFTNRESFKGHNIEENSQVALLFFWPEMMLQVRVEGTAVLGTEDENTHCYSMMPRNMKVLAVAYKQSSIVEDREKYMNRIKKVWQSYPSTLPYPPGWTAYRVIPDRVEFWN
eukprot:Ihof_evm21s17 gene=Ihof_evmTU21s17